jgi:hypothetical protein
MTKRSFMVTLIAVLFVESVLVALYAKNGGVSFNGPGILCFVWAASLACPL